MRCSSVYLYRCCCPRHTRPLALSGTTYYPDSGLVAIKGSLHAVIFSSRTRHYAEAVVHALASGCAQPSPGFLHMGRVCRHIATCVVYPRGMMEIVSWMVFSCHREALRLQRWFRELLFQKRVARRLALAMALHPRLGVDSCLGTLCVDALRALAGK